MITIVLAEDHQVVRQALRVLLEAEPDLAVVGEVGDGLKVAGVVGRLKPDVLIVDLVMPGLHGLEIMRRVRRQAPEVRVVVLSMYLDEAYVAEALRSGAVAYVAKMARGTELVKAVHHVMAGRRYLSPPLCERAVAGYEARTKGGTLDPYQMLTPREQEVLHLAAEGYRNVEIAARLAISVRTVESHRAHLMQKLGLRTPAGLIRYALQRGIVPLDAGPRTPGGGNAPRPRIPE